MSTAQNIGHSCYLDSDKMLRSHFVYFYFPASSTHVNVIQYVNVAEESGEDHTSHISFMKRFSNEENVS